MNCERVHLLLDIKSAAELTAAERQAVDQHLASCGECRDAWEAYGELAALRIPATPRQLRTRIAAALLARAERHRVHRGLIVGAVLLAGAAVAATAVLRLTNRAPDPVPGPVPTIEEVVPAVEPVVPAVPESPAVSDEPVPSSPEPVTSGGATNTVTHLLDPLSLVVVAVRDQATDAETAAAVASCYDAVVEQVRGVGGLNVIAGGTLARSPGPEFQVARELGAGSVLILSSANRQPTCVAVWRNLQTGATHLHGFSDSPRKSWRGFGEEVAASVREWTFKDAATLMAEARATVLNTARGDHERMNALLWLRPDPAPPTTFDEATVAVAVHIGLTSRDASARAKAWYALRGVNDPYIVQPLLYALENDSGEGARAEAALTLASFADQPAVRDALMRAAAEVPAESPPCCFITVRSAARLALRGGDEPTVAVRKTVLDESLTPQERLVLVPPRALPPLFLRELGAEAAQAVFALGSSSDDNDVRSQAWGLLGDVSDTRFVPALLEDLARHPAERVRAAAAAGLRQHRADPGVRAALDRAMADSSLLVQRAARNAVAF